MAKKTVVSEDLDEIQDKADDTVEETVSSQQEEPVAPSKEIISKSGPKFVPLVLGGICAAGIGFGAAQYTNNPNWPFAAESSEVETLQGVVDGQSVEIRKLQGQLLGLQNNLDNLDFEPQLAQLESDQVGSDREMVDLSSATVALNQRLTDLENRPIPKVGATTQAVEAYERELSSMRAMFQAELQRIEAAQSDAITVEQGAADRAEDAEKRAAAARLQTAINSGGAFGDAVQGLSSVGIAIPDKLNELSDSDIATLAELQVSFPIAARSTLNRTIDEEVSAGQSGRIGAFLRKQLGTRSLEPKAGDDADAILSRAEGHLKGGNVDAALGELDSLSDAGKAEMSGWIKSASARQVLQQITADIVAGINQ